MSQAQTTGHEDGGTRVGNADAGWTAFDPEAYFQHYYGDAHPDDDDLTRLAARALCSAPPMGGRLDVLDVGTGPSLIPLLCAVPRARRLTAWEFAPNNVAWLKRELAAPVLRPQWQHFWQVARQAVAARAERAELACPEDPLPWLQAHTQITQGSIFDLPRAQWDAATMFFCAESITSRVDEFETALNAFATAVRPGGLIAAAFLVGSQGYDVAGRRFPAISLGADDIESRLASRLASMSVQRIGLTDREVRSGYTGALFVSGCTA